ncbi:hypothetical protein BPUTEOMOX_1419 [methanotrophic endosymbiont of Bathymodiolus puteoserpentis (Logatchev)]|nr:hypothetical protein BPUTEOMOX_1419 [methanotrophic endosymbiont of Bathymodiolus puteoserpentis (Logatchev)]
MKSWMFLIKKYFLTPLKESLVGVTLLYKSEIFICIYKKGGYNCYSN